MTQLFTAQELMQGIPAITLLTLVYRPIAHHFGLYPPGHPDTINLLCRRHSTNRYLPLPHSAKRTKTIPLPELLDDFLLEISHTERKTAYDATVAYLCNRLSKNPLDSLPTGGLALHWMLQYAHTHSISYKTFVEGVQQPILLPTPKTFQTAGAPAVIEITLIAEWELRSYLPTLSYRLRDPATKSTWREVPVTVKIETTNSHSPTTGTLQLGYGTDCPGSAIHLQDELLQWLQIELTGTPIFYNKTRSSPLRISIPTP